MGTELPTGTVTFVFTDVEGSTSLLKELGAEAYADALADHRMVIREACMRHGGVEVDTQGDAFFFAFPTAPGALDAASEFTDHLAASGQIRVRVGVHTGTPFMGEEGYVGHDVHRAARVAAAGHGGQVLVSAATAMLVDAELTDLGEHRFKDLGATERVFQLGEIAFPPLKSLYRTNLPVPATSFLGREHELASVTELLRRQDLRLLTLTGPGGTGKTRLAVQAAAAVAESFPDGVYWVGLAALRDASLLPATFAQALEVVEQPDKTVAESVVAMLAAKRALLVVDNCEHLLEGVADFVSELVDACRHLVVAASSRERLGLRSERVFAVPPLTVSDAMALFTERAQTLEPSFVPDEHVPAICATLDELPLAIELAAARVRSLSTAAIRERLAARMPLLVSRDRDVDERQRTLEATIAWSYDLLAREEQRVLRALSVFAGGCTLEAAEAVAGADLDLLESLLDKSLVRHRTDEASEDRYWMLETIREYAAARLDEAGEGGSARSRHRDYFCALAPHLGGDSLVPPREHVARYAADRGNFRVVFTEALERKDGGAATLLVASLVGTWQSAGEGVDSYELARAALALPSADERDRGWALDRTGVIADDLGRWEEAQRLYGQALENARHRGDTLLACEVTRHHASMFIRMGEPERATEWAQRSVDLARELGSEPAEVRSVLTQVGAMTGVATDRDVVDTAALERCLAISRELAPRAVSNGFAWMLDEALREILFYLDRYAEALPHAQAALQHFGATSVRSADGMLMIGLILGGLGEHETGVTLVSAGRSLNDEQGWDITSMQQDIQRFETGARLALEADAYEAAARAGEALTMEEAVKLALSYPKGECPAAGATAPH